MNESMLVRVCFFPLCRSELRKKLEETTQALVKVPFASIACLVYLGAVRVRVRVRVW